MPGLRKRKATESVAAASSVKKVNSNESATSKIPAPIGKLSTHKIAVGDSIDLESFGGEVETHDGKKVTLKSLVQESQNGVVLFTYPRASTPGCTTQACLFRDDYTSLTATGFSIYGLSTDSPKSNTTFRAKQNLPYSLLCDPKAILIAAIGMKKSPSGTVRGVFVVNKEGKVEAAEPGGPAATVDTVRQLAGKSQNMALTNDAELQNVKDHGAPPQAAGTREATQSDNKTKDRPAEVDSTAQFAVHDTEKSDS